MVLFVSIEEIYELHQVILHRAKSRGGIRDFTLLHSAIERPKSTFGGRYLYPTLFSKAASLLQSLCFNHAFSDGNKRIAWAATKRFLWINGYHLKTHRKTAADFLIYVDNHKPDLKYIAKWLKEHTKQRNR